jgi:hypothetical protein
MIGQLIEEWIFVKNSDPIFLPGTIGAAVSQEKITKKINPLSVFKTIYIVVRHQIKTAPSLVIGSKITFRKLGKSLGNYLKLFWFLIRDFKTADMLITSQLLKTKKLEKIEKWIQNNS